MDGDPLSMNSSQVGVLKERDKVSFGGFLQSTDGRRLEAQVGLEVLGDFADKSLKA